MLSCLSVHVTQFLYLSGVLWYTERGSTHAPDGRNRVSRGRVVNIRRVVIVDRSCASVIFGRRTAVARPVCGAGRRTITMERPGCGAGRRTTTMAGPVCGAG